MIKIILLVLLASVQLYSDVIKFEDKELERYLLTQDCAFTIVDSETPTSPDLNKDGKLDTDEAKQINELSISDFKRVFDIKSIKDLNHYINLSKLTLIYLDSLTEVSNMKMEKLNSLYIADCRVLHHIDISNLTALTESIKIEGLTQLHYLNLKNGSVAEEFSMFYTIYVDYACIDSIDRELEILVNSGTMTEGKFPSYDCNQTSNIRSTENSYEVILSPNPTNGFVEVKSGCESRYINYRIVDINGVVLMSNSIENQSNTIQVDFSSYRRGIYYLTTDCNNHLQIIKVIRE